MLHEIRVDLDAGTVVRAAAPEQGPFGKALAVQRMLEADRPGRTVYLSGYTPLASAGLGFAGKMNVYGVSLLGGNLQGSRSGGLAARHLTRLGIVGVRVEGSSERQLVMFSANRPRDLEPPTLQEVTPQQLQSHLAELPRSTELPESVYIARLSGWRTHVKLLSVRLMMRRGVVAGPDDVLACVEGGGASPRQAYSVIVSSSESIVVAIWYGDSMADANRLLDDVAELLQDVLQVGSWVQCSLGWGRITRIEHVENDGHIEWCLKGDSRCRVILTLRPDLCEEEIAIDLGSSTADFPNPDLVYACGKCHSFATQSQSLLRLHYNSAHRPRNKAEARLPMFYHLEETPVRVSFLRSSEKAPGDQWM